jgi:hypothetical protein
MDDGVRILPISIRREVAKEDLGMDPTWNKEKRTTTKNLVQ